MIFVYGCKRKSVKIVKIDVTIVIKRITPMFIFFENMPNLLAENGCK